MQGLAGLRALTANRIVFASCGPASTYSSLETMPTAGSATEAKRRRRREWTFAEVLRANQSMVFSLAYHFLRDRGAAEEVAQDVFLRLYRKLEILKAGSTSSSG